LTQSQSANTFSRNNLDLHYDASPKIHTSCSHLPPYRCFVASGECELSGHERPTRHRFNRHVGQVRAAKGCYIGAFIERDDTVRGRIDEFEEITRKKHASYFTYVGYGCPFPGDWVAKVKATGAVPQIAMEPNYGLDEVRDDAYLRAWARDAARTRVPIFLRWGSEMNGPWTKYGKDPKQYVEKFRLVTKVMREEAPNVAMVWTPFSEPTRTIASFYPGDDHVDWVGVNVYSVYVNNGDPLRPAWQRDPLDFFATSMTLMDRESRCTSPSSRPRCIAKAPRWPQPTSPSRKSGDFTAAWRSSFLVSNR
jgi:hypothetical protein